MKFVNPYEFDGNMDIETYDVEDGTEEIGISAFKDCFNLKTVKLPQSLTTIDDRAFLNCMNLSEIQIPKAVTFIGPSAFKKCSSLLNIKLPQNLQSIQEGLFSGCYSLQELEIPDSVDFMGTDFCNECFSLKKVKLPKKFLEVKGRSFYNCNILQQVENDDYISEISAEAFAGCKSLQSLNLIGVSSIGTKAFADCSNLFKITFDETILKNISQNAFKGCNFKYFYRNKTDGTVGFCNEILNKDDEIIDLKEFEKAFTHFDIGILLNPRIRRVLVDVSKKLKNSNFTMPFSFLTALFAEKNAKELLTMDFRYLSNELKIIRPMLTMMRTSNGDDVGFYKFAKAIGCFCEEKLKDKTGRQTDAIFAQKASTFLYNALKSETLKLEDMGFLFRNLSTKIPPNQELLEFLSFRGKDKEFINLNTILYLEQQYKKQKVFETVIKNFDEIKAYRHTINEKGKPATRSWQSSILAYLNDNLYKGITLQTKDIATELSKHGLSQQVFDETKSAREEAIKNNITHHILGEELKEKTILESIEEIRNKTSEEINNSQKIIEDLYNKQFTYEMLDKYDPKNAIIGIYCSCCATITNQYYGRDIARSTITKNDVQNMVIRDNKGDIVAKTAMYVNKEHGYIVLNDFEINEKYRHGETEMRGIYTDKEDSNNEKTRELIFSAFKRGLKAFVEKYNQKNPNNEIQQITVGTDYNRLKRQCYRYKYATKNLFIPAEYSFKDAEYCQIVLYKKDEKTIVEPKDKQNKDKNINNQETYNFM